MTALCGVCQQSKFRYTCPRCEIVYCSLPCYQKHSSKCTESFYQRQIQEELRSQKPSDEERKHLEHIVYQLNRLDDDDAEDEDEDDGAADEEAEDRHLDELAAKAEGGELDIEDLTEEEARRFHSEIKRGSLGRLLNPWEPWWHRAGVVEVEPSPSSKAESGGYGPATSRSPPQHICCSEGRKPHAAVALTALSAIYAYAHTMRAFNGDWAWAPLEAAPQLLHLCPAICSQEIHNSTDECLRASLNAAAGLPGRGFGKEFNLLCLADCSTLIKGGADFAARALREIDDMLEGCLAGGGQGRSGRLQRGVKKVDFLASFAFHHFELLHPLAAAVDFFLEQHEMENQEGMDAKHALEHGGVLVPERS